MSYLSTSVLSYKKRALIISVSHYDNNLVSLSFCQKDGEAMHDLFKSRGYEIAHKLVGKVKYETMRDAIIDFLNDPDTGTDDILVLYYSGHGIPDVDGVVYISSSEMDPHIPNRRGFSLNELTKMMNWSISRKVVTILDCCYSGAATLDTGSTAMGDQDAAASLATASITKHSQHLNQGEGKCILSASQAAQEAYALKEADHSIYTHYLIEGLKGNKESVDVNGNVTPFSLGNYVFKSIMNLPENRRPKQKPVTKALSFQEIVLANYPALAGPRVGPVEPHQLPPRKRWFKNPKIVVGILVAIVGTVLPIIFFSILSQSNSPLLPTAHGIPVGNNPVDLTVNPTTNMVYVANQYSNTVSVIDGKTNAVGRPINVGNGPSAVAVNPITNMVYVVNSVNNTISVIDGRTNAVGRPINVGKNPADLAVNPKTNMVYVSNQDDNTVSVIDGKTNKVVGTIYVNPGPHGIAVDPLTNMVYVANSQSNTVSVIDARTEKIVFNIIGIKNPADASVNPNTNMVYVSNQNDNTTSVIDGKTNAVVGTVKVGKSPNGVDVNPNPNVVYVANQDSNTVSVIYGKTNAVGTITVGIGKSPADVSVDPLTNIVYVANSHSNTVSVINGKTNSP